MSRKTVIVMVFLIVVCISSIFLVKPSSSFTSDDDIKVGLYYYVWYDEGYGNRHWNDEPCNTVADKPILGYYSSQSETIIKQHLSWMKDLGIDFLIISWWGQISGSCDNSYEDNSTKILFDVVESYASDWMKLAIMVEGFNESAGPEGYDFPAIYDYLYDSYAHPYNDIYLQINNKPVACWFNFKNMTAVRSENRDAIRNDSRFEARIVGHSNYVDWWFGIPCGVDNSTIPPLSKKDGMICVEPRYDDQFLRRENNSTFDENLAEGLYDFQWKEAIRLAEEGKVNYVTVYSWNEYHERSQIEPHLSKDRKYVLSLFYKTKYCVDQIKSFEKPFPLASLIYSVSCAIFIFGILVSSYYLYQDRIEDPETAENSNEEADTSKSTEKEPKAPKEKLKTPETPKWSNNKKLFRLQYEQLSQGLRSRDSMTIIAGSILITASLLLLGSCMELASQKLIDFNTKILMTSTSLAIYVIWLIGFNLTSRKLNSVYFSRLRKMEKEAKYINIHTYNLTRVKDEKWFKYLRRLVWLYFLWVLIIVSIAILSIPM